MLIVGDGWRWLEFFAYVLPFEDVSSFVSREIDSSWLPVVTRETCKVPHDLYI